MHSSTHVSVFLTTFSDLNQARQMAQALLEEQLIACLHVTSQGESYYYWENNLMQETEYYAFIKVDPAKTERFLARFQELHPYTTPQAVGLTSSVVLEPYAKWVQNPR